MLFEKPRHDYYFVIGLWVINFVIELYLDSLHPSEMIFQGQPPSIVQNLPNIVTLMFGVYLGIFLTVKTYTNVLGPKLERKRKNLIFYGISAFTGFVMTFGDLITILARERIFYNSVFHFGNNLAPWQEYFLSAGFPLLCLFLIWCFRNQKLEFEKPSPVNY